MRRIGWHLDDVPQPFLTMRRFAFVVIVLFCVAAGADGLLLGYDATHNRSVLTPLIIYAAIAPAAMIAGGLFAWTNKKSPRWLEWRRSMSSLTPGWPPETPH